MGQDSNNFDFDGFVSHFMREKDDSFSYTQHQLKIYPLALAAKYIKAPVPLFRAKYSFILFFKSGGGIQQVDNEIFNLKANDVLFIREGHLNSIKSISPDTSGFFLYVDNLLLPQIFDSGTRLTRFTFNPKHSTTISTMEWLLNCCELIYDSQQKGEKLFKEISVSLAKAMVQKLEQSWPDELFNSNRNYEITMSFKELLHSYFLTKREVTFYANELAISENHLTRCVKSITEKTPKQHINQMLVFHSKVLLQDLSKDISKIAFELNFSDPSYFGRLFKDITDLTPTAYRNRFLQDLSE